MKIEKKKILISPSDINNLGRSIMYTFNKNVAIAGGLLLVGAHPENTGCSLDQKLAKK